MKRNSIICIFAVCFFTAVFSICYFIGRYRWGDGDSIYQERLVPTQPVDMNQEVIISNISQIIVEKVDMNTADVSQEKIQTPMKYLGMNRSQLIEALRDEVIHMSTHDKTNGLISCELISFTRNRVVIRKTYSRASLPKEYYIMEKNGYLAIYLKDKTTLYDNTDILYKNLDETTKKQVKDGLYISSLEDLYDFLQNHTS